MFVKQYREVYLQTSWYNVCCTLVVPYTSKILCFIFSNFLPNLLNVVFNDGMQIFSCCNFLYGGCTSGTCRVKIRVSEFVRRGLVCWKIPVCLKKILYNIYILIKLSLLSIT